MSLSIKRTTKEDAAALYGMLTSDITDRLSVMQRQESYYTPDSCLDQVSQLQASTLDDSITDSSRSKMAHWCYQLTDVCTFQRETVCRAMNYLDRFLVAGVKSTPSTRNYHERRAAVAQLDKREYQLASMSCLYIAVKMNESLAMDATLLSEISHGCYTPDEILSMETSILHVLEWKLNGPTVQDYITHLLALLEPSDYFNNIETLKELLDMAKFQAEIAVTDHGISLVKPSVVAVGSILNALEGISQDLLPCKARYAFFQSILRALPLDMDAVESVQQRLRRLFYLNSGADLPFGESSRDVTQVPSSGCGKYQCLVARAPSQELTKNIDICMINSSPRSVTSATQRRRREDVFHARCPRD